MSFYFLNIIHLLVGNRDVHFYSKNGPTKTLHLSKNEGENVKKKKSFEN